MGFFSELKEDLSQAVNELLPNEEQEIEALDAEGEQEAILAEDKPEEKEAATSIPGDTKSLEEMLESLDTEAIYRDTFGISEEEVVPETFEETQQEETLFDGVTLESMLENVMKEEGISFEEDSSKEEIFSALEDSSFAETEETAEDNSFAAFTETEENSSFAASSAEETAENEVQNNEAEATLEEQLMDAFGESDSEEKEEEILPDLILQDSTAENILQEDAAEDILQDNLQDNILHEDEGMEETMKIDMEENVMEDAVLEESAEESIVMDFESELESAEVVDETAVITAGMTINGDMVSKGSVDVIGTINGNIDILGKLNITGSIQGNSKAAEIYAESAKITGEIISEGSVKIGQSSVVIGNISANSAVIAGAVKGDIDVHGPVILDTSAIVMGNIKSKSVQINNGAVIEGMCSQCYADVNPTSFFEDFKKSKGNK